MAVGWKLHGDGKTLATGEVVAPDERLDWPRTVGLGAQHVVAMFDWDKRVTIEAPPADSVIDLP